MASKCTLMSSSQTSDRNTNMASSFELSSCCSFVDAFTQVAEGPPKKLILPKHDLVITQQQKMSGNIQQQFKGHFLYKPGLTSWWLFILGWCQIFKWLSALPDHNQKNHSLDRVFFVYGLVGKGYSFLYMLTF